MRPASWLDRARYALRFPWLLAGLVDRVCSLEAALLDATARTAAVEELLRCWLTVEGLNRELRAAKGSELGKLTGQHNAAVVRFREALKRLNIDAMTRGSTDERRSS